jgi:tape measure domain-containing protein
MAENTEFKVVVGADISEVKAKLAELSALMGGLANNTDKSNKSILSSFKKLGSGLSSIGSTMSAALTAPLALLGVSLFKTTAEVQQITTSFEVFTGSATTAKNMLQEFKNIAINSPLQFQDIAKGAQTLLGYGLTANQVVPITKMLGDISGGNADKFARLSLAFGQVNAAGRLMGQETRQMINAGFNPLQSISEKTGESMASLTKRMEEGRISVDEVAKAFIFATSEGGRFYGMAEKQAETLGGMWNKVKESFTLALAEIGDAISKNPAIKQFFTDLTDLITRVKDSFLALSPETQAMVVKFLAITAIAGPVLLFIGSLISSFTTLIPLITLIGKGLAFVAVTLGGWPILIGTVLVALGLILTGIDAFTNELKDLRQGFSDFNKETEKLINNSGEFKFGSISKDVNKLEKDLKSLEDRLPNIKILSPGLVFETEQKISSLKKELQGLYKIQNDNLGFSKTPKSVVKPKSTKAEKVKTIYGTDFILKEEGNRIKKLIQLNNDAANDIDSIYESSLERKLERLKQNFVKERALYVKYGLEFTNVSAKYLIEKIELEQAIRQRGIDLLTKSMDNSITKLRGSNPFQPLLDTTNVQFGFDEAKIASQVDNMKRFGAEMYQAQVQVAVQLASGFAQIVGSVISGDMGVGQAFASLGAMFLDAIGGFLVQVGQAAVQAGIIKLVIDDLLKGLAGGALIGVGMAAIAIGTAMQNVSKKTSDAINNSSSSSLASAKSATGMSSSGMNSGSTYRNGSATYGGQAIRLSIDLTGAITASPTGYNINKSLETILRVTGRE